VTVVSPPVVPAANVPAGGTARDAVPGTPIAHDTVGSGRNKWDFASQQVGATQLKAGDVILQNGAESQGSFVVTKVDVDSVRGTGGQAVYGTINGGPEQQLFLADPHGGGERQVRVQVNAPAEQPVAPRPPLPPGVTGIVRNDISDPATQARIAALYQRKPRSHAPGIDPGRTDGTLGHLYDARGYQGMPDVVSEQDLDNYVAAGEIELWRGLTGAAGPDLAERFRTGKYSTGLGMYGNGMYTAYGHKGGEDAIQFTQGSYASSTDAQHMRMTLKADARVIEYDSLLAEQRRIARSTTATPLEKTIAAQDPSHLATYMGYDAIRKSNAYNAGSSKPDDYEYGFLVVLNRTAVRVSNQTRVPNRQAGKPQSNGQTTLPFSSAKHGQSSKKNKHPNSTDMKAVPQP
jgi:hypothetical protein